ncbi:MAG: CSLREA domain-containing protein [Chloroflexi bacterium]|nr:CSLREA domain-containing protein [Chloroflexota bacterium]MCI0856397.1 CSLREA domain-containing protein [Chloroflexota bacterium]
MKKQRFWLTPAAGLIGLLAVALVLFLAQGQPAYAAGFTVDSTADVVDASPGDGVCDDGSGNCTLRAAIMEANALAGADTIDLPAGTYTLSIAGAGEDANATGDLDITDDLTISGAAAASTIVDGAGLDRVFHIIGSVTVEISGLTIQHGSAVSAGGGIFNLGTLTLTSSTVSGNTAGGEGGGIANLGTLTLDNSTVTATRPSSTAAASSTSAR